jgi:hypothetical protein
MQKNNQIILNTIFKLAKKERKIKLFQSEHQQQQQQQSSGKGTLSDWLVCVQVEAHYV